MSNQQAFTPVHWSYFLALEDDLYRLSRFVDFTSANYKTYSIEIARLLLGSSAEVDSVLKQLVKKLDPTSNASSIGSYYSPVTSYSSKFLNFKLIIPRYGIELSPWSDWAENHPPGWWTANNKVKHHRHTHFDCASLENCLNSMAALLVSVLHLYSEEAKNGCLIGLPRLFSIPPDMGGGQRWWAKGHSQLFYLNDSENPYFSSPSANYRVG